MSKRIIETNFLFIVEPTFKSINRLIWTKLLPTNEYDMKNCQKPPTYPQHPMPILLQQPVYSISSQCLTSRMKLWLGVLLLHTMYCIPSEPGDVFSLPLFRE